MNRYCVTCSYGLKTGITAIITFAATITVFRLNLLTFPITAVIFVNHRIAIRLIIGFFLPQAFFGLTGITVIMIVFTPWDPLGVDLLLPAVLQVSNPMAKVPHEHVTVHKAVERTINTY